MKTRGKTSRKDIQSRIYQNQYDNSLDLYRTVDAGGKIISCNKSYAKSLGYSIREVIGSTIFLHVAEKSSDDLKQVFEKWRSTGLVKNHEIWLKRKDGTIFPVLLSVNNMYDEKRKLLGSNTVMRDISEIYQIRREIGEIKSKRLEVIGELSARIAHDLRNPLSIIKMTTQFLESQDDPTLLKYSAYFSKIQRSITRMSHQVEEVLEYIRPQSLNVKTNSILNIMMHTLERFTEYPGVKIIMPKNDAKIECDAEKLEIVFLNLILNAIQAMGNKGKIHIRICDNGYSITVEVEDTGPGIHKDLLPKIFDPLFTTRMIGTGLGLPSCKNIIEKHGGAINVKTKIGKGTTFLLYLPKNTTDSK